MKKGNGKNKKNRSIDSNSDPSPPGDIKLGNSPKRSRKDNRTATSVNVSTAEISPNRMDIMNLEEVASQVIVVNSPPSEGVNSITNNRLVFINSQRQNRYSSSNHPPYLVHIETIDGSIGNIHPMRLGKALSVHFPAILNIKRLGKNIISVNFKFSFDANNLVQSTDILPENWLAYIPNYKIIRTGIVRGVDPLLSNEEIIQGLKWRDRPLEIKSIERLKFRDTRNNNELKNSSTIKIDFVSNLLPEYISIWSVKSKVKPYINRTRKCFNCLRWGHSAAFCRGSPICSRCGDNHESEYCQSDVFQCPDCKLNHAPFDFNCSVFQKYRLVNHVMAFCNTSQFIAKRLIKSKNITDCSQVESFFKSSAYFAWDKVDLFSEHDIADSSSVPSVSRIRIKGSANRRIKLNKRSNQEIVNNDCNENNNNMDNTLVPIGDEMDKSLADYQTAMSFRRNSNNTAYSDTSDRTNNTTIVDKLFPSPGVIIKDIYELFKADKTTRERDAAVINYIKLLFQK